jgi:hypothetical protein
MRKTIAAVGILLTSAVGGVAEAREYELSIGGAARWLSSPGVDVAARSDSLGFFELGAAASIVDAPLPLVDRLAAELHWQTGSTSAMDFQQYKARLSLDTLELGVRAEHDLHDRLRAFVRAGVGGTRGALSIDTVGDVDWTLSGSLGAGLEANVLAGPQVALGVRVELGVAASGSMSFAAEADAPSDGAPIDTAAADLGDLDAGGAMLRIGVFGRF